MKQGDRGVGEDSGGAGLVPAQARAFQPLLDQMAGGAILDRPVHNAHRIELRGDSLRRQDPEIGGPSPPAEAAVRDYPQHIGKKESNQGVNRPSASAA